MKRLKGRTVYYHEAKCRVGEKEEPGFRFLTVLEPSTDCEYGRGESFVVSDEFIEASLRRVKNCEILA
jgi:hypothetical protein